MTEKDKSLQIIIISLGVSLFLHTSIFVGALYLPVPLRVLPTLPVEIIYKDSKSKGTFTVVKDPDLGVLQKEVEDKVQLLSKYNRRVKKQSVAREKGPSQNLPPTTELSAGTSTESDIALQNRSLPNQKKSPKTSSKHLALNLRPDGDIGLPVDKIGLKMPHHGDGDSKVMNRLNLSNSTSGEYIPNIEEGNFTSLNTDQFLYYSFFSRINDQIRYRWISALNDYSTSLSPVSLKRISSASRLSVIEVLLHSNGYLKEVLVNKSSGDNGLDQSAVTAFIKAAPFLNPPAEMVKEDGLIHLIYSFHVEWAPRYFVRDSP